MAVAMAIDLGLNYEATIQMTSVPDERERVRLTWWAVVLVDRINSWGTFGAVLSDVYYAETITPFGIG